jgi:hypothetical protein
LEAVCARIATIVCPLHLRIETRRLVVWYRSLSARNRSTARKQVAIAHNFFLHGVAFMQHVMAPNAWPFFRQPATL